MISFVSSLTLTFDGREKSIPAQGVYPHYRMKGCRQDEFEKRPPTVP
jgi:hypothetical protein